MGSLWRNNGTRVLGVMIIIIIWVGILTTAKQGTTQGGGYTCWGGCYNACILKNGQNPSERLPCYWNCLGSCIAHTASDYQYYCQFGCSLQLCFRYSSDGAKMEQCVENCSNKICSSTKLPKSPTLD